MRWTTKARIQRALSRTPGGEAIYYLGQRYVGGFRRFSIDSKVRQGLSLLECLSDLGETVKGRRAMELGTGWAPIVPTLFWLYGQEHCDTYDTSRLLKHAFVRETARQLSEMCAAGQIQIDDLDFEKRLRSLRDLAAQGKRGDELLCACGVDYHAPSSAAATMLADNSVDLVYSNTVLEHVPRGEVRQLFGEFHRILRSGGYMLHLIDVSDHFAHSDPSISSINFLQYSEDSFSRYNSRFIFQNRLRPEAWRKLISEHGFKIVYWKTKIDEGALSNLSKMRLDDAFADLSAEEICSGSIRVVAQKP